MRGFIKKYLSFNKRFQQSWPRSHIFNLFEYLLWLVSIDSFKWCKTILSFLFWELDEWTYRVYLFIIIIVCFGLLFAVYSIEEQFFCLIELLGILEEFWWSGLEFLEFGEAECSGFFIKCLIHFIVTNLWVKLLSYNYTKLHHFLPPFLISFCYFFAYIL